MATVVIGDDFATPKLKKRTRKYDASGLGIIEVWICSMSSGSWAIGDAHPDFATLKLVSFDVEEDPPNRTITLEYRRETFIGGSLARRPITGTVVHSSDSNVMEIPIEQHPDYSVTWEALKPGVTSFISPQPTYRYEKSYAAGSVTFNEGTIISTVGKRVAPTGMTSPTTDKWLHVGRSISEQGDSVLIADVYQYAANGWDTDIYPAG
jgi:hypothetical protein